MFLYVCSGCSSVIKDADTFHPLSVLKQLILINSKIY